MISRKRLHAVTAVSAAALLAVSGCSTKASNDNSSSGSSGGSQVKTGRGVSGDTIKLGSLTDLTGVFAALGKDITNAQALYWADPSL